MAKKYFKKPFEPISFIYITINNNNNSYFSIEVKMGLKHCHLKPIMLTLQKNCFYIFFPCNYDKSSNLQWIVETMI
jgi:hypothetical protein